ncbi:hypothetical protein [Vibrio harveyi]|uniref:hypothetical protein n=1 Tax=Vibrio harveyi TaxID=669 RepID=UPI00237FF5E9|nr:hypothetical protein [Vibrio harveyi]
MTESNKEAGNLQPSYDRKTDFPLLISQVEGGVIANVLGLAFSNVALAVANSSKQGEVNIKIKLKPASQSDPSIVQMITSMSISEPKPNFGSKREDFKWDTVAHIAKGGKLSYDRPAEDVRSQLNILPDGISHLKV